MDAHHVIDRGELIFRHNLLNGMCLCTSCHMLHKQSAHRRPKIFEKWMEDTQDPGWLGWWGKNNLAVFPQAKTWMNMETIYADLCAELAKLEGGE